MTDPATIGIAVASAITGGMIGAAIVSESAVRFMNKQADQRLADQLARNARARARTTARPPVVIHVDDQLTTTMDQLTDRIHQTVTDMNTKLDQHLNDTPAR